MAKMAPKKRRLLPKLAVLETAEWYDNDRVTSIKPLLQIIMQHLAEDPSHFLYSTFVNKESFKETLEYFSGGKKGVQYIHIACHGSRKGTLYAPSKEHLSSTIIGNRVFTKRTFKGVFLAACESTPTAKSIAEDKDTQGWVAGYGESVEWLEATAFEMLFWQTVLHVDAEIKSKDKEYRGSNVTSRDVIEFAIKKLCQDYIGLITALSPSVYIKKKNTRTNEVEDLIKKWKE